ncbi:MAG: deoxyribodipyrimidine photo-lyase, partial [Chromatiales bacterium]
VFTPFWKACLRRPPPAAPLAAPEKLPPCPDVDSLALDALGLLPRIPWDAGLRETWRPGEAGALRRLDGFCRKGLDAYADARERPAVVGTSRLSPRLHFGELSPRQVWWRAVREDSPGGEAFLRELGWREFAHHLLHHSPETLERPMDRRFEAFPWREDPEALRAWQSGRTGIPLVDAGMRELWHTGWMHNRVRMVVASLLTKNLRIHWLEGARWFWDTLVDADLANNTLGWQWVAGCGADAAPYFRIFNPVTQGQRYDPEGAYVRRWVPEIGRLPDRWVHRPWQAPEKVLREAGIRLGSDYPEPIVDLKESRREALAAYEQVKAAGRQGAR